MKYFIAILILVMPILARGATCPAGQYLENGECIDCGLEGNYCPGDDTRHACPSGDGTKFQQLLTDCGLHNVPEILIELVSWGGMTRTQPSALCDCIAVNYYGVKSQEGWFIIEEHYNTERSDYWNVCNGYGIWFYAANPGYYLSHYLSSSDKDYYMYIKPCTNEHPAHSHYSGPGTPDEPVESGGRKDYNDCPWECDDGYGRHNNECVPLCAAGATKFHVGDYVFNIYADKLTTPAINIGLGDGSVCYVPLVQGSGKGALNVDYHGTVYHTSD